MIKKAAVINDLSGFGKCSLTAAIAVLSVMGIQPCPMPTAVLTNQTGYKHHYGVDMTEHLPHYSEMWQINGKSFDGIYSGYVSSGEQLDIIAAFITDFRKSYTRVLVDPVMADDGRLYSAYNRQTCEKMCELSKRADLITPNLTEFCIIAGIEYEELIRKSDEEGYLDIIAEKALAYVKKQKQSMVITGIFKDGFVHNAVISDGELGFVKSKQHGGGFSGTGDLFASIMCGGMIKNTDIKACAEKAASFLESAIADTVKEPYERNDGINFEKFLHTLA